MTTATAHRLTRMTGLKQTMHGISRPRRGALVILGGVFAAWTLSARPTGGGTRGGRSDRRSREQARMAAMLDISAAVEATLDVNQVLARVGAAAALAVGRQCAEVTVVDGAGLVEARATHGLAEREQTILDESTLSVISDKADRDDVARLVRWTDEATLSPAQSAAFHQIDKRQSIVTPLIAQGQIIGQIDLWTPGDRQPTADDDLVIAAAVGQQGGLALRNARLLATARKHAEERAMLLRVSQAATSSLDLSTVLTEIARATLGIAGAEACMIELWHPETDELEVGAEQTIADWPGVMTPGSRYPADSWPSDRLVLAGSAPLCSSVHDPDLGSAEQETMFRDGIQSMLRVSLMVGDDCLGILTLYARQVRAFDDDDVRLAQDIASQISLAIANSRLLAEAQRRTEEQAVLLRVSQAVISNRELDQVLHEVAAASLGVAGAECCEVELLHLEREETELVAQALASDWTAPLHPPGPYPLAEWPMTERVLTSGEPMLLAPDSPLLTDLEREQYFTHDARSLLILPIQINGAALGVLNLYSRRPRAFSVRAVDLGRELANQAALAIERVRLHDALAEQAKTDSLTGILNRRAILEALDAELDRARHDGTPAAVLMIDLDDFKLFNDAHGHIVGDGILREAAALIRGCMREGDRIGRYGGDEFLAVLPGTNPAAAIQRAEWILTCAAAETIAIESSEMPLRLSIGLAVAPADGVMREGIVAAADQAMYAAKQTGIGVAGRETRVSRSLKLMPTPRKPSVRPHPPAKLNRR